MQTNKNSIIALNPIMGEAELLVVPCYDEVLLCDLFARDNKMGLLADLEGFNKVVNAPLSFIVLWMPIKA